MVVTLLYPGGLGTTEPVRVTSGETVSLFRALSGAPSWVRSLAEAAGDGLLVVLGLVLAWVGWTALRRRDARGVAGVLLVGLGTVVAYGMSEALKLVVDEERPCRVVPGAQAIAHCPALGDWSFPSNHATIAAALAVGLALIRPRLAGFTLPLAAAVALARVVAGVHYPHDVAAGAALATAVVIAMHLTAAPLLTHATTALLDRPQRRLLASR